MNINLNLKTISIEDFIEKYQPLGNPFRPFNNKALTDRLGHIIYDKKDYNLVAAYMGEKRLWTVLKEDTKDFRIIPGSYIVDKPSHIGYIISNIGYHKNDLGVLSIPFKTG